MKTNESSGFRFYSKATVAANKKRSSKLIEAVPIEDMPMLDGELSDNTVEYSAKGAGKDGENAFEHDLKTTASVEAEWLPWGSSNRITAPDVRRGAEVLLFKYKDVDKYYWISLGDNRATTRLETVTHAWSNERKENVPLDASNTYWMEVSTHDKYIHLQTSKNDGEPFAYIVQINTKDGSVVMQDDVGNLFLIDSKNTHIRLQNKEKSFVDLNKRVITIESAEEVNIKTRKFSVKAEESIALSTKTMTVATTSYQHKSNSYGITTMSYSVRASSIGMVANESSMTGAFNLNGSLHIGANLTVDGTSTHIGRSTGPGHAN